MITRPQVMSTEDAVAYLASAMNTNNDIVLAWTFENDGSTPSVSDVDAHFAARAPFLYDAMACRIADFPLRLDRPVWVRHDVPISERITHHQRPDGFHWTEVTSATTAMCEPDQRIDAVTLAWRLHVFHDVRAVPQSRARTRATVVVLHASHALLNGISLQGVSDALFSDTPELLVLDGQSRIHDAPIGAVTVLRSAAAIPVRLLQVGAGLVRRRGVTLWTIDDNHPLCKRTSLNRGTGDINGYVVRLPRSQFQDVAASPSVVMLAALGVAVTRYLASIGEEQPPYLAATMTVKIDDPEGALGVNHVHDTRIDIGDVDQPAAQRAARIAAELRAEIDRGNSAAVRGLRTALGSAPWPAVLWTVRKRPAPPQPPVVDPPVLASVLATTINLGKRPHLLGNSRCLFAFMPHHVGGTVGLAHFLIRTGADYSITITASTDAISEVQLPQYAGLVEAAIADVCRELTSGRDHVAS